MEVAGPEVTDARDLARTWRSVTGRRVALIPVPVPGKLGRALRAGVLTTARPTCAAPSRSRTGWRRRSDRAPGSADKLTQAFEAHRGRLLRVAYATVGSVPEAEDCVQEAWLRLQAQDPASIRDLGAWLTTTVSRLAWTRSAALACGASAMSARGCRSRWWKASATLRSGSRSMSR